MCFVKKQAIQTLLVLTGRLQDLMLPDEKMCALLNRPQNKSGFKPLPVVIIGKFPPASVAVFSSDVVSLGLLVSALVPRILTQARNAWPLFLPPFPDSQTSSSMKRKSTQSVGK